eukprot:2878199-Alexandrium_andersonii.AAC.1
MTQRRCFVVTHGECGADCVRAAIAETIGTDVYVDEVTAEDERSRGPSAMARVIDSAAGLAAVPKLVAAGMLRVAGGRYEVLKDAVVRPQPMPTDGPDPVERTYRALRRMAGDGVGPRGSLTLVAQARPADDGGNPLPGGQ